MNEKINQPTYKRQRFLLAFICQIEKGIGATDLQKLVFLHTMIKASNFYEFAPYKYGAFSFQLNEDVDILSRDGYLSINNTSEGKRIKANVPYTQGATFEIPKERGKELVRMTYRKYPYYAVKSKIVEKLFHGQELEQIKNGKLLYDHKEQILFTIGYEGKTFEAFINALILNDVRLLCDVRKNPISRKFGFSKSKLEHILTTIGIKYVHIPELGIESDKRRSLETPQDYQLLFSDYVKTLPSRTRFLETIHMLLMKNSRIALMCYEMDPKMCHRHVIRDYIVKKRQVRSVDL